MREIKFRAWDKFHKRFICKDDYWEDNVFLQIGESLFNATAFGEITELYQYGVSNDNPTFMEDADSDRYILEQYTGLKDKNGKEIYEGDILKIGNKWNNDTTDIAEVKWYRGGFMLKLKGYFGYRDIEYFDKDCEKHEVIGNIHENPKLITK